MNLKNSQAKNWIEKMGDSAKGGLALYWEFFYLNSLCAQRFQTLIWILIKFEVYLIVNENKLWILAFYITMQQS